jgi:hypothetical protein
MGEGRNGVAQGGRAVADGGTRGGLTVSVADSLFEEKGVTAAEDKVQFWECSPS